ncbi:tripartite tricarboxylate transporter substrate binding protein [Bordetella sp. LUAb4]|uniref:Bug family tripartite tricarboxylate transporter substrate binding protein n=1 Tax=Bordetella sp. LUAb4 TaxID=2843195 RepID=UPI001E424819|nr:tripartite tricarboxylate transporter substrate binding protein [Bordetella sp. LUAb4]
MTATSSNTAIEYPRKPITLIIGGPPGAGTDILTRRVAERLEPILGQRVVIEYRLGASGNLAAMAVAHAEPDGHTLLIGTRSSTLHKTMYPHLKYDFVQDLTPVAMVARMPIGILMGNHVPAKNIADFVRMARAEPGRFSAATLGVGTSDHLVSVLLRDAAEIQWQHVPYVEVSRALTDVVGGRVDLLITQLSGGMAYINAGELRALAVSSAARVAALPGVPTVAEEGYPQVSADEWFAAIAPAKTPPDIIKKLNHAFNQALTDKTLREEVATMGYVLSSSDNTPDMLRPFLAEDKLRWTKVLRDHQIYGDK